MSNPGVTNHRTDSCVGCACRCDQAMDRAGGLSGWRLTLAATGMFLVPLGMGIAGAVLCGPGRIEQVFGGVGGLVAGAGAAIVVGRFLRARRTATKETA